MRILDLLALPILAMWQQKTRTLLTTLGVVFGSFVLAASLSIGQGVQDTIERESHRSDYLRKIIIGPNWRVEQPAAPTRQITVSGEMSDAKRERIRKALTEISLQSGVHNIRVELTQEKLKTIAGMEHVEAVVPVVWQRGSAIVDDKSVLAGTASVRPADASCRERIVAGRFFQSASERTAVVSEFLAYQLGLYDDAAVNSLIGKKLSLVFQSPRRETGLQGYFASLAGGELTAETVTVFEKLKKLLPVVLEMLELSDAQKEMVRRAIPGEVSVPADSYTDEFTIIGVVRMLSDQQREGPPDTLRVDAEVLLPVETALNLFFHSPGNSDRGIDQAIVVVDQEKNAKNIVTKIAEMGLATHAPIEFIERERLMYLLIFASMTCVAAVAMLVASLGIANTMLMSVLERTREIGIMKAVGAGNGQLQFIFLVEGALIGLCGGVVGLLLAWGASIPGDAWVRDMVYRDMKVELKEALFVFPPWLTLIVIAFSVLFTTLAAVYPARRAASIDPVTALRHE